MRRSPIRSRAVRSAPTAFGFGPIPALVVGTALLLTAFALVCAVIARRPDRLTILVGVTLLAVAFFVLPTRVHERYLFPFFALGAILAGDLAALAGRVHRPVGGHVPQHVRGPDDHLPGQPRDRRLAGDRSDGSGARQA